MNLLHHFLVAMPNLQDPFFKKAVVYVCEHNEQGAMGIVINHPLPLTVAELLLQLKIKSAETMLECPVFHGGPVATDRGFILHSPQAGFSSSLSVSQQTMLTNSRDILETLGTEQQPEQLLVALGYASWQAGQLERELADNSWLTLEADADIIYHTPINKRWQHSINRLGIGNSWQLVSQAGHA